MRTIIVGDVHGCRTELEALLDRVAFGSGDRLVFVGDLLARGPDSLGVLDIVRSTGAIVVRGNHEDKILQWQSSRDAWIHGQGPARAPLGRMHRDIARALRPTDWTLLETSPYWLDLPEHDLRVVHAGVQPGLDIEAHKPETLTRLRTLRVAGGAGREKARGRATRVLWGACYTGPPHVVFGHNAAPGLQLHRWATGIDTGCVYGGRLTALVLAEGQKVPRSPNQRRALFVSEPARRVWYELRRTPLARLARAEVA